MLLITWYETWWVWLYNYNLNNRSLVCSSEPRILEYPNRCAAVSSYWITVNLVHGLRDIPNWIIDKSRWKRHTTESEFSFYINKALYFQPDWRLWSFDLFAGIRYSPHHYTPNKCLDQSKYLRLKNCFLGFGTWWGHSELGITIWKVEKIISCMRRRKTPYIFGIHSSAFMEHGSMLVVHMII